MDYEKPDADEDCSYRDIGGDADRRGIRRLAFVADYTLRNLSEVVRPDAFPSVDGECLRVSFLVGTVLSVRCNGALRSELHVAHRFPLSADHLLRGRHLVALSPVAQNMPE